jgi:hypothetical protein
VNERLRDLYDHVGRSLPLVGYVCERADLRCIAPVELK